MVFFPPNTWYFTSMTAHVPGSTMLPPLEDVFVKFLGERDNFYYTDELSGWWFSS